MIQNFLQDSMFDHFLLILNISLQTKYILAYVMPKFLTGNLLNQKVGEIIEHAEKRLILISPYIRLHPHYKNLLKVKLINPDLHVIVLFAKSGANPLKNIAVRDVEFFKQFTNIELRVQPDLNAKYYANEKESIITSMDLYDYSQEHHIEAGVLTSSNLLDNILGDSFDVQAYDHFLTVVAKSEIIYKAVPKYSYNLIGQRKFKGVEVEIDLIPFE